MKVFEYNPELTGFSRIIPDVVYSQKHGLKLTLISPWGVDKGKKYPLVVFVQGSAWTFPDITYEIPQLSELSRRGYVVATITHRSAVQGHPWPAYLEDTKCAIRFLRANAEKYGIDGDRVCIYGTSSGGNTSLLAALTGDYAEFKTDEYADQSDAVQLSVECFGPTDLPKMIDVSADPDTVDEGSKALIYGLAGTRTPEETIRLMSPVNYVEKGKKYPPFLMIQGDADQVVPYEQAEIMLHKFEECGCDAELIRVKGAEHEGNFWSKELVEEIFSFIQARL